MNARLRWVGAVVALAVPALAIGATGLLWSSALRGDVASHWSDLGPADGSLPGVAVFSVTFGVAIAAVIVGAVAVALPRVSVRSTRAALFWMGSVGAVAAGGWLIPAGLTVQAGSAKGAVLGGWVIVLALAVLYGAVPYLVAPRDARHDERRPATLATPLRATETGAWSRTITAKVFVYVTVLVVAIAAAVEIPLVLLGDPGAGAVSLAILLAAAVVLASFIRVRITVDWRGLRIVSLLLRLPLKRIPLDRILRADAAELRAGEWGGWGYRIMPGRSALILRDGPGLVVTTTDDREFAVSVSDPEVPAGLLNSLRSASVGETRS